MSKIPLLSDNSMDSRSEPTLHKIPNRRITVGRETTGNSKMKTAILVWITLQNSVHSLLLRYSRARQVDEMYIPTVAVFITEIMKLVICLLLVAQEEGSLFRVPHALMTHIVRQPTDTLKVCVPSMIYIIQNNLFYIGASHLDAATFMITSQLKIFTAAVFTVAILRRSLSRVQWIALGILFIGVSLVQLQSSLSKDTSMSEQKPFIGFMAVVVACWLSGFAGIYFEKILKNPGSLWMRNIQMGVFGIPASLLGVFLQDGKFVADNGLLYGFDWIVWLTVFWYGVGGLSVAICLKYADNIAKNFATSVAIIISTVVSIYIFDFQPSLTFSLGALLVITSIFLYSSSQSLFQFLHNLRKLQSWS